MTVHQVLDLRMPPKDLCKFSGRIYKISQFHIVPPLQGPSLEGPDWITVQQQTRDRRLYSVYQAGKRLDLTKHKSYCDLLLE